MKSEAGRCWRLYAWTPGLLAVSRNREVPPVSSPHGQAKFAQFVDTQFPPLKVSLNRSLQKRYRLRRAEADDIVQDVMIKMQVKYCTPHTPEAWAFRAADREALNYVRSRQRHRAALNHLHEVPDTRSESEDRIDDELRERFVRVLPKLTHRERKLWQLLTTTAPGHTRSLNQREIAHLWGLTHGSARQLTSALYKKIRRLAGM